MNSTETCRTEAAAKIQKRHWDVIQREAEEAGDYLEWLRTAAMREQHALADDYARKIRAAMNKTLDRLERLDAIREMRDIYEMPVSGNAKPGRLAEQVARADWAAQVKDDGGA